MVTFTQGASIERTMAEYMLEPGGSMRPAPALPVAQGALANDSASADSPGVLISTGEHASVRAGQEFNAQQSDQTSGGFDWFETFHVVPRSFTFGNLLSDQSSAIEVFCSFRRLPQREWTSFTNNAGAGIDLGGIPILPVDLGPLAGVQMTLDVSTLGPAFVSSTLDFLFTGIGTAVVPITLQRIVLFGLEPELPFDEILSALTKVYTSKDGTEKREKLRANPRQSWLYRYIEEEGPEAQLLENLLFDFQSRKFGVPVWFEDSALTVAVSIGDIAITVDATDFRDYRVGGTAIIFTSQGTFDVLTIDTGGITATSLTFTSPTLHAYPVGTLVFPLAVCRATAQISGTRWVTGLRSDRIRFHSIDNDVQLGDLSPFSSYNSKLFFDGGNAMSGITVTHKYQQPFTLIDGATGLVQQDSNWDRHKRGHELTFRAEGRQAVAELRGLVYAIAGRWISFYVPTDSADLVVNADLLSASNTMSVDNVGYTQFVRNRQPKSDIRVHFVDGSTPLLRAVTASSSPSVSTDQLTVDTNWPSTITVAEIERVEYLEKVRFDSDDLKITYDRSGFRARMTAPIVAVFE